MLQLCANDTYLYHIVHSCLLFFSDQDTFQSFVGGMDAHGGGDFPEDVMGGLNVSLLRLAWREGANKVSLKY